MFDLIIRGGRVHDGLGSPERIADVGVRDGVIVAVEPHLTGEATEVIDAAGRLVTPGFVDIHTHYDGQATWDELLEPSTSHGVTTVVFGNCGVGFAPVRPDAHAGLIELMEGVEDIPGAALAEGLSWGWESFPDYLDVLEGRRWSVDVAAQLPHGPLRAYVMGPREAATQDATPDDVAAMARLTQEAFEAGAVGFTTSRTLAHLALDGTPVPGTYAGEHELFGIGRAVAAGGGHLFEVASSGLIPGDDQEVAEAEVGWIGRLAVETGLTSTFILLQCNDAPDRWRRQMDEAARWRDRGGRVQPLVAGRPAGLLWGWDVRHPFLARDTYRALAQLPLAERLEHLRRADVRAAILEEEDRYVSRSERFQVRLSQRSLERAFTLVGTPDYEQGPEATIGARAEQRGSTVEATAYDELLADDAMLLVPAYNYVSGDQQAVYEQMLDPDTIVGLADGGAHVAIICDASIPTYLLTHWARDRTRGPRLALPEVIRRLTSQTADLYGFTDRGRVAVGLRADLNVIHPQALALEMPRAVHDLPAGGTRLLQGARGYEATVVAGQVTRRHGVDTGARPGRLVRG